MLEWIARHFCKPVRSYQARVLRRWQDGTSLLVQVVEILPAVPVTLLDTEAPTETVLVSARSYRAAVAGEIVMLKDYAMGPMGKPTITVLERT